LREQYGSGQDLERVKQNLLAIKERDDYLIPPDNGLKLMNEDGEAYLRGVCNRIKTRR
jgi:hypothetical protein